MAGKGGHTSARDSDSRDRDRRRRRGSPVVIAPPSQLSMRVRKSSLRKSWPIEGATCISGCGEDAICWRWVPSRPSGGVGDTPPPGERGGGGSRAWGGVSRGPLQRRCGRLRPRRRWAERPGGMCSWDEVVPQAGLVARGGACWRVSADGVAGFSWCVVVPEEGGRSAADEAWGRARGSLLRRVLPAPATMDASG